MLAHTLRSSSLKSLNFGQLVRDNHMSVKNLLMFKGGLSIDIERVRLISSKENFVSQSIAKTYRLISNLNHY